MKSYFAKLAARATLPNAPPTPYRAIPMNDPFENVSTAGIPTATENVSSSEGPKTQSSESRRPQSTVNTEEIVLSRGRDRELKLESDSHAQGVTRRPPDVELDHDVPERSRETERADQEAAKPSPVLKLEPTQSARPQVKQHDDLASTASAIVADTREPATSHASDQNDKETNAEQTLSLKKADEFMNAFFARRTAPPVPVSNKEEEQPEPAPQIVTARESSSRLQPAAKPRQPPEPPPEQPSLVIGKLTVEVVPPPSPVMPRREVVVVRAGSNSRPASIHSSQRFGLGQF